jgi:hypothetical protein
MAFNKTKNSSKKRTLMEILNKRKVKRKMNALHNKEKKPQIESDNETNESE